MHKIQPPPFFTKPILFCRAEWIWDAKVLFVLLIAGETRRTRKEEFFCIIRTQQLMCLELGAHLIFKGFILMSNFSTALVLCLQGLWRISRD